MTASPAAPVTAVAPIAPLVAALTLASEAGDINALKDVAATAAALQKGARARGMGIEAENQAAEVIIRAERAIGSALNALPREPGGDHLNSKRVQPTPLQAALEELDMLGAGGTGRGPNATAQRLMALARIPESEFEARFATVRDSGARIAKVDFYRLVKGTKVPDKPEAEKDMHGDGFTPAYSLFAKAAKAVIADIAQLPADELLALAGDLQSLVNAYNAERARRG